jgi:hypothetical protein
MSLNVYQRHQLPVVATCNPPLTTCVCVCVNATDLSGHDMGASMHLLRAASHCQVVMQPPLSPNMPMSDVFAKGKAAHVSERCMCKETSRFDAGTKTQPFYHMMPQGHAKGGGASVEK